MTSKVFVRFVNENQWVRLCRQAAEEDPVEIPEDVFVEWAHAELDGNVSDSQLVPFSEFVDQLNNRWHHSYQYGITLIISGTHTFTAEVNIPSRQTRHIAQALPYMIEDQLAQDVSGFHLVTGDRATDGQLPVLGIPTELIEGSRALFQRFDLPLDSIVPDMLCLPRRPSDWTLLFDGKHLILRRSELDGLSIEMDAAPIVLAAIMEHWQDRPEVLRVLFCLDNLTQNLQNWIKTQISSQVLDADFALEFEEVNSSDFHLMCDHIHLQFGTKKPRFDFLQGRYASSARRKPSTFNWKPVAALVAIFVVSYTAYLYTSAWKMNQQVSELDSETRSLYRELFPQDRRIVNVKRQMEQHLSNLNSANGNQSFLALLALTGAEIFNMNRGGSAVISPRRISYDEGQGDMRLDLLVKDFGQLEAFKSKLEAARLGVETASATQDKEGVKARLKIWSERS